MSLEGAIAANRFGLGAKPGEIARASTDPRAWLKEQLTRGDDAAPHFAQLKSGSELVADLVQRNQMRRQAKAPNSQIDPQAVKNFLGEARQTFLREMAARFVQGVATEQPFRERLVRFWSNHFVVSTAKPQIAPLVGAFEREAIRPHVTGRFADMVEAAERHPAMQLYLDNAQSIGPDSMAGRRTEKGLNENLGREILELHTLGVNGGYTQDDVIALAKILTGWSVDRGNVPGGPMRRMLVARLDARGVAEGGFRFYPPRHEPGTKVLLGTTYPEGYQGGVKALNDLAHHPATARHVATKLAVHFISDTPPETSVKRIETAFLESNGHLPTVYNAIVDDEAAWAPAPAKFRTPVEFVSAALRALGGDRVSALDEKTVAPLVQSARAMGELPFGAPSPKGWPDTADGWTGSDAVLERVQWSNAVAQRLGQRSDPLSLADAALGPQLSDETRSAIARAASPPQGVALLLASPEFQWR